MCAGSSPPGCAEAVERIAEATLRRRIAAARAVAEKLDVEALLLYAAPRRLEGGTQTTGNVHYFTGWTPLGAPSAIVLPAGGEPIVIAGGSNEARVFRERAGGFAEVRQGSRARPFAELIRTALVDGRNVRPRVGIAGGREMPAALHGPLAEACEFVAADRPIHDLRLVREPEEVACHRRAAAMSDRMIQRAMDLAVVPGVTPAEIMSEVEFAGRRMGADLAGLWLATGPAPPVTCFELFELPPAIGPHDRIQLGTIVSYEGHFAQGLRVGVRGRASRELKDCAQALTDIQDAALAELVPGRPVHRVVDIIEGLIDRHCPFSRSADPFRFQSCHGLGLDYSEPCMSGSLSPDRDRAGGADGPLIGENMVFEIHPNFTVPGLGHVCVGDTAVATPQGGELLTRFPRGLVMLD